MCVNLSFFICNRRVISISPLSTFSYEDPSHKYVKFIEDFKIKYLYLLFLLVWISFMFKEQRRPLQEGELWQEILANMEKKGQAQVLWDLMHIQFLRGRTHMLLNKQTNKKVQNCASKIICKNKYSFRISKQIRCFWSLQV